MGKKILLILFIFMLLTNVACEKADRSISLIDGTYQGKFCREITSMDTDTATVTITFTGNTWTGTSNMTKYPALCSGTYSINGDSIHFVNECVWTAEFDWSLILDGNYYLKTKGSNIEFYRNLHSDNATGYTDKYMLSKFLEDR